MFGNIVTSKSSSINTNEQTINREMKISSRIENMIVDQDDEEIREKKEMVHKKISEMEYNRIDLFNLITQIKKEYSEQNKNALFASFNDFLFNHGKLVHYVENAFEIFTEERTKLKNKIISLIMNMDEKISLLNLEKMEIKKQLGLPSDKRSENLKKFNQRLTIKIENYKQIILLKEKVIKNLKKKKIIKNNFVQLEKLKNFKIMGENNMLLNLLGKDLKVKTEKLTIIKNYLEENNFNFCPVGSIFDEKENSFSIQNIHFKKSLKNFKEMEKKIYQEKILINATKVKEFKDKIKECNEKINELDNAILNNELDLKMYKRIDINNKDYGSKQEKIIELKVNKINYLKDQQSEFKESIQKFEGKLTKIYKSVSGIYSENSHKIKCVNVVIRSYLNDLKKREAKQKMEFISNFALLYSKKKSDLKIEILIKQYKGLQLVNNTLQKRFLKVKCEKIQKLKQEENNQIPEQTNESEVFDKIESGKKEINNFLQKKDENLNEMKKLMEELNALRDKMKIELDKKKELYDEIIKQKVEINQLETEMRLHKDNLETMEEEMLKLELSKAKSDEGYELLKKKIESMKLSVKTLKNKKRSIQRELAEKNEKIEKLNEKIAKLLENIEVVYSKNDKLKANFEKQFESLQCIFNGSFEQYALLESLLEKEKIFNKIFDDQKKAVKLKDKKIIKLENQLKKLMQQNPIKKIKNDFSKKYELEAEETIEIKLQKSELKYKQLESQYNTHISKVKDFEDKDKVKLTDQIDFLRRTIKDYENIIKTLRTQSETHETNKIDVNKESNLEDFLENLENLSEIEENNENGNGNHILYQNKNFLSNKELNNSRNYNKSHQNQQRIEILRVVNENFKNVQNNLSSFLKNTTQKVFALSKKFKLMKNLLHLKNLKEEKSNEFSKNIVNTDKLNFLENILDLFIKYGCNISKEDYIEINFEKINQYLFKSKKFENENLKIKSKTEELKERIVLDTSKIRELEENIFNLKNKNEKIETETIALKEKLNLLENNEENIKLNTFEKKNMELQQKINEKSKIIMELQKNIIHKKKLKNPPILIKENSKQNSEFSFKIKNNVVNSITKNNEFSFKKDNKPLQDNIKQKSKKISISKDYESPYSINKIQQSKNLFESIKTIKEEQLQKVDDSQSKEESSLGSSFNDSELVQKKMNTFNFEEESKISNCSNKSKSRDINAKSKNEIFEKSRSKKRSEDNSNNTLGSIEDDSEIKPKTYEFNFEASSRFDSKNSGIMEQKEKNSKPSKFKDIGKDILNDIDKETSLKSKGIKKKTKNGSIRKKTSEINDNENFLESLKGNNKTPTSKINIIKNRNNVVKKKKKVETKKTFVSKFKSKK